jgi:hemoglobin-like flavoprotein
MSHSHIINACLECLAANTDDLAPAVYQRFFALYPEARELFGRDPYDHQKGAMIVSLLLELMNFSEGNVYTENVKRWIYDHKAYGVTLPMYQAMFDCLQDAIAEVVGANWTAEMAAAWGAQFAVLDTFLQDAYNDNSVQLAR